MNPSASTTGAAGPVGALMGTAGARPCAAPAARAAVVSPKKADPATPKFTSPFTDCFQLSWPLVGSKLDCIDIDLDAVSRAERKASHETSRTESVTSIAGNKCISPCVVG